MQANTGKLYQPLSAIPKAMERAYCSLVSPLHVADLHCLVCCFFFSPVVLHANDHSIKISTTGFSL